MPEHDEDKKKSLNGEVTTTVTVNDGNVVDTVNANVRTDSGSVNLSYTDNNDGTNSTVGIQVQNDGLDLSGTFDNSTGNVVGNVNYSTNLTENITVSGGIGAGEKGNFIYNANATYNQTFDTNIGDISARANIGADNGEFVYGAGAGIETKIGEVAVNANVDNNNGEFSHNADVTYEKEFKNGVVTNVAAHSDKSDNSVTVGVRQRLINADNINDLENKDRVRKEELVETGERFNFQTKVGYSNENKEMYTENSLMYRVDDNNFLKTDYNHSESSRQITAAADLKDIKIEYSNNFRVESNVDTTSNTVNLMSKGKKNQYNLDVSAIRVVDNSVEDATANRMVSFGAGAKLNRTEYGEFQSGLNGAVDTGLTLQNGSISGYKVNLEGAYNYYGFDHGKTTDWLVSSKLELSKEGELKNLNTTLSADYRLNNCRTIFESYNYYRAESSPLGSHKEVSGRLGVYQQVGKNFGDASVYLKGEVGKRWVNTTDNSYVKTFAGLYAGGEVRATERLAFTGDVTYCTDDKWCGNIGVRYSF